MNFVRKIDKMRAERGWSIYKLTHIADISQQTYHQWLNTDTMPSLKAIMKICDAFGITLAELFAEHDLVELTPEMKELFSDWKSLTKDERMSVEQIIKNYVKSKNK